VNAALARVQPTLPATAKLTANRLTFAAFPIVGYSLVSDTMSQTQLWELGRKLPFRRFWMPSQKPT
jgi:hypothetical protein